MAVMLFSAGIWSPPILLKGTVTGLRAIERADLSTLLSWRNKPEFRIFFREHRELSASDQDRWFDNVVLKDPAVRMFSIIELANGRLMGACGLCYINWVDRSADLSIYLGADDLYIDDRFAPDAARTLIRFGFDELGLHRIWAEIYSIDTRKQAFFEKLGFALDGRHRESHWTQGGWVDSLFYGLLAQERAP
jgi:RimJ/RimL family protein N-acetyltransferase